VRIAVDTGGTFTDLVAEDEAGALHLFKSPTTPEQPAQDIRARVPHRRPDRRLPQWQDS
jgi:N-methylhydantoinase A/oxoprolinase/acetone carboxylase beta subunit